MASLADILATTQQGVTAVNNLVTQMKGSLNNIAAQLAGPLVPGKVATETDQEAATSITLAVTPGRQQFHPSAAKAWVLFSGSSTNGAQTVNASYNVSGVTRASAGVYTATFTVPFTSANYASAVTTLSAISFVAAQANVLNSSAITAVFGVGGSGFDPPGASIICFGDQ